MDHFLIFFSFVVGGVFGVMVGMAIGQGMAELNRPLEGEDFDD